MMIDWQSVGNGIRHDQVIIVALYGISFSVKRLTSMEYFIQFKNCLSIWSILQEIDIDLYHISIDPSISIAEFLSISLSYSLFLPYSPKAYAHLNAWASCWGVSVGVAHQWNNLQVKFLAEVDGENTMKRANSPVLAPVAKPVANEEEPYKLPLMVSIKPSTVGPHRTVGWRAATWCSGVWRRNHADRGTDQVGLSMAEK